MAPLIIPFLKKGSFRFNGKELRHFHHRYNMTWAGERCVEIPIADLYLSQVAETQVLEVGNVLSHYRPCNHMIVDKYEKGPGVQSVDIVDFESEQRFALILSISTFEHIGFDDSNEDRSGEKISQAIHCCRRLLSRAGLLVITVPVGYNPDLDRMLESERIGASCTRFLVRTAFSEWRESSKREAMKCNYGGPYPYANALAVIEFSSTDHAGQ
jgi:hypothetical protein